MSNMTQKIRQAFKEPENLILGVGVIIAAVLAYVGIRNNDIHQALNAILAVLGSLAIAQIVEGYEKVKRDKQFETMLTLLQRSSRTDSPHLRSREELIPLPDRCPNAEKILLIGPSLAFVVRYTEYFKQRLLDKATLRFVLMNPENSTIIKALVPLLELGEDYMVADIRTSLAFLKAVSENAPRAKQIEVRVIDYVPPLSFAMIDGHLPKGHIIVQLFPYKSSSATRPHLLLTPSETHRWYTYFRDVCENIWRDATPLSLEMISSNYISA